MELKLFVTPKQGENVTTVGGLDGIANVAQ